MCISLGTDVLYNDDISRDALNIIKSLHICAVNTQHLEPACQYHFVYCKTIRNAMTRARSSTNHRFGIGNLTVNLSFLHNSASFIITYNLPFPFYYQRPYNADS